MNWLIVICVLFWPGMVLNAVDKDMHSPTECLSITEDYQPTLKADYSWQYIKAGYGTSGTLKLTIEPNLEQINVKLYSFGECLMSVIGDTKTGYKVQIPRQKINKRVIKLTDINLPIFKQLINSTKIYEMLVHGIGVGAVVVQKDTLGPTKLQYRYIDDDMLETKVIFKRLKYELTKQPINSK